MCVARKTPVKQICPIFPLKNCGSQGRLTCPRPPAGKRQRRHPSAHALRRATRKHEQRKKDQLPGRGWNSGHRRVAWTTGRGGRENGEVQMHSTGHLEQAAAGLNEVRPRPPAPQPWTAPGTWSAGARGGACEAAGLFLAVPAFPTVTRARIRQSRRLPGRSWAGATS